MNCQCGNSPAQAVALLVGSELTNYYLCQDCIAKEKQWERETRQQIIFPAVLDPYRTPQTCPVCGVQYIPGKFLRKSCGNRNCAGRLRVDSRMVTRNDGPQSQAVTIQLARLYTGEKSNA